MSAAAGFAQVQPLVDVVAGLTVEQLSTAVVAVAASTFWPDGSLLLDLDDQLLRELVAPALLAALTAPLTAT